MNDPKQAVLESLRGLELVHGAILALGPEGRHVRRRQGVPGKVALVSGGGSGHEPAHVGFVGRGMLDAACPGHIFTSPTPDQILEAMTAVAGDAGTLLIVKNYEGDIMNFEMAAEMASGPVATVVTEDDVAVEASTHSTGRRGVAGTLVVQRILGAAAERGLSLEGLVELGRDVNARTRSMGVALSSCTIPASGRPTFTLSDSDMEMGVGIHGEPGRRRVPLVSADAIAEELLGAVLDDLGARAGSPVLLLVNGFGATPALELYLMAHAAGRCLAARGLSVTRSLVGSFVTSLDMAGCSLSVTVLDDRLLSLWDDPVHTAALRWNC